MKEMLEHWEQESKVKAKRNQLISEQAQCIRNLDHLMAEMELWKQTYGAELDALEDINYLLSLDDIALKLELERRKALVEQEEEEKRTFGKPIDLTDEDLPF